MRSMPFVAPIGILMLVVLVPGANQQNGFAAPPVTPLVSDTPSDPVIADLIAKLGDPDYQVREKAGQTLETKGDKVLPDLRRALSETENAEIGRRLAVLVRKMEHDRLVSAKTVTLSMKNKSAKDVFAEISKQTGYQIDYQSNGPNSASSHSFEFKNTPFWVAVDKVADATGSGMYSNYDDDTIQINSFNTTHNPYVTYSGPFRFVASNINTNKNVQLSGLATPGGLNRSMESINLNFQIFSEPKNPVLGAMQAELISATDDLGGSLVPPKDHNPNQFGRSHYYNQGFRGFQVNGNANLIRGLRDATTIKSLKAKIGVVLLTNTLPEISIADPLKVKDKKFSGRTYEIEYAGLTEAAGQFTASLTLRKKDQDPGQVDYNWVNTVWQRIELLDAKGERYRGYQNGTNFDGTSVNVTIMFNSTNRRGADKKLGPPVKLVVNEWLQVMHEVVFEFKNIPLP